VGSLRSKFQAKYPRFGEAKLSARASGKIASDPATLIGGLGLNSYYGKGEDFHKEAYEVLERAIESRVLSGLFDDIDMKASGGVYYITLPMSRDLMQYRQGLMGEYFVRDTLAVAELMNRIALPNRTFVERVGNKVQVKMVVG
jgi:hypothetical protein